MTTTILDPSGPLAEGAVQLASAAPARIGGEVVRVTGKSGRSGGAANNAATACESQVLESLSKEVQVVLTGSAD